ncbi:MAG: S8 family peptidase [Actinomycetota bacterium]
MGFLSRAAALVAVAAATALGVPGAAADRAADGVVPGSYIVALDAADPAAVAAEHGRRLGVSVDYVYRSALRGYAARMSAQTARRLSEDGRVRAVTPDRTVQLTAQTVPPGIDRVDADVSSAASGDGKGSVDVDIAVIDTGIDAKHRDLTVAGGASCVGGTFRDGIGHGTHVAGIAAARDNRTGVVGVAPGARLWAVRVFTSNGLGTLASVLCGVDWVTANAGTIEVANMSLGAFAPEGSCTDGGLHEAICASVDAGVTYVVAAGNDATNAAQFVPASYDEVITVSAVADFDGRPGGLAAPTCPTGHDDTFAAFSNFGPDVDLTAPGVCVLSTVPGSGYATYSGTSMSSPHVAGAAALYASTHPGATPAEIKAALTAAGTLDWLGDRDTVQEPLVNVGAF